MNKKNIWIDPPGGWKYGFPKLKTDDSQVMEWLVKNGYPQQEIDQLGNQFFTRQWEDSDDD